MSEGEVVDVGWVSLSRSGKSLSIMVLNQIFFVPLRDLEKVLNEEQRRASVKQWIVKEQTNERPANEQEYFG